MIWGSDTTDLPDNTLDAMNRLATVMMDQSLHPSLWDFKAFDPDENVTVPAGETKKIIDEKHTVGRISYISILLNRSDAIIILHIDDEKYHVTPDELEDSFYTQFSPRGLWMADFQDTVTRYQIEFTPDPLKWHRKKFYLAVEAPSGNPVEFKVRVHRYKRRHVRDLFGE